MLITHFHTWERSVGEEEKEEGDRFKHSGVSKTAKKEQLREDRGRKRKKRMVTYTA